MRLLAFTILLFIASPIAYSKGYIDVETGLSFPEHIADFKFSGKREYDSRELGFGVNYAVRSGTFVTIIVYDLGVKKISNGIKDPFVEQQFIQIQGDIKKVYKSVRKFKNPITSPLPFLKMSYSYVSFNGTKKISHLFVRGQLNKIIEVRATRSVNDNSDAKVSKFMSALSVMLESKQKESVSKKNLGGSVLKAKSLKNQGSVQDYQEAVNKYRKAASQGDASAQFSLGYMYFTGRGVVQDDKEAVKWFSKAASQGDVSAQTNLGYMYAEGRGVIQDYKEAVKWFRKAANQGISLAQDNLGYMYAEGRGVIQDYKKAVKWYRKAANQELASAQLRLGLMYALGWGVVENNVLAHMWYNLAASNGNKDAVEIRKVISKRMTSSQIEEAQSLAREWKPSTGSAPAS